MADYIYVSNGIVNKAVIEPSNLDKLRKAGMLIFDTAMMKDKPQVGWSYNYTTGKFSPPPESSLPHFIYLHVIFTGGDGKSPLGIINDGTSSITVNAKFRQLDTIDSAVITNINGTRRVAIRGSAGLVYDQFLVNFVEGEANFVYTTNSYPDICFINEGDLTPVVFNDIIYTIKLVGTPVFKVYRLLN